MPSKKDRATAAPDRKAISRNALLLGLAGVCTLILIALFSYYLDYSENLFHIDCGTGEDFLGFLQPHERFLHNLAGEKGLSLAYGCALLSALILCILAWRRFFASIFFRD